jgi:hypothetical protein
LSLHSLFAAGAGSQGLEEGPTAVVSHTDLMNEEGLIFLGSLFFCSVVLFRGRSGVPSREMAAQSQKPPTGTHARTVIRLSTNATDEADTRTKAPLVIGHLSDFHSSLKNIFAFPSAIIIRTASADH